MKCIVCKKPLRKDNSIGTCRAHRALSPKRRAYETEWKSKNALHYSKIVKEWRKNNKKSYNDWFVQRRKNDESFRIAGNIRNAIKNALRRNANSKYLPCSLEQFKKHLESKFKRGMSWENYGLWQIDHIIPLGQFNLKSPKELAKACSLKNVQPLWKEENLKKRSTEYISKSAELQKAFFG